MSMFPHECESCEPLRKEVERLQSELAEARKWRDRMTETAGMNRERYEKAERELAAALEEVETQKAGRYKAAGAFEKMLCDRDSELAAVNERVEKQRVLLKALSVSWRLTRPRWRPSREKP